MKYLPIYVNIKDKQILVIGAGRVAEQKLNILLQFTSNITVLAESISESVSVLGIKIIKSSYAPEVLSGTALIYACTNDRALNKQIKKDAGKLNIPVNVVDDPELCDFITPAVYTDDNFSIAVSTFGNSPSGAAHIRNMIKNSFSTEELNKLIEEKKAARKKPDSK
jgi:siroheme synthase-like protein